MPREGLFATIYKHSNPDVNAIYVRDRNYQNYGSNGWFKVGNAMNLENAQRIVAQNIEEQRRYGDTHWSIQIVRVS